MKILLPAVISVVVGVMSAVVIMVGWSVTSEYASKRDFENAQREIITEYLIDAYRGIASAVHREELNFKLKFKVESALENIQLLGNEEELKELGKLLSSGGNDFTSLLRVLRNDLRKELKLPGVDPEESIRFYRFID